MREGEGLRNIADEKKGTEGQVGELTGEELEEVAQARRREG